MSPTVRRHELTDAEWAVLAPLLPPLRGRGHPYHGHRVVLNGLLYWKHTGVPWRACYNVARPHGSLVGRIPQAFVRQHARLVLVVSSHPHRTASAAALHPSEILTICTYFLALLVGDTYVVRHITSAARVPAHLGLNREPVYNPSCHVETPVRAGSCRSQALRCAVRRRCRNGHVRWRAVVSALYVHGTDVRPGVGRTHRE